MEAIVVLTAARNSRARRGFCAWYHAPYLRRATLARTSPQDLAADGLRACTRRRLASSLRCASVTGMASGVATRLSQSSSISSSRSSTLSERACLSTVLMFAFSAGRPQAARIMSVRITLRVSGGAVEHGTWRPRDHAVRSSRMLAGFRSPEDPTEATSERGSFKRPLNPKDGQTYDPYENTERNEG